MSDADEKSPPPNDDDELQLAPLPETWQSAKSPAYQRPPDPNDAGEYEVGPEVDPEPFAVGSQNWKEAAAGVQRSVDQFDIEPEMQVVRRRPIEDPLLRAERELAKTRDARIGRIDDPFRFTLRGLLMLTAAASIALAFGSRLPRGVFAGICGASAIVTLILSKWIKEGSAVLTVAWWMLMALYLLASIFAMFGL